MLRHAFFYADFLTFEHEGNVYISEKIGQGRLQKSRSGVG
jgi:hypothetical protein